MSDYLIKAIKKLKPTAEFSLTNNDYSTIKWDVLEGTAPTKAKIDEAIEQVKADEAQDEAQAVAAKAALLDRLGITADEARLLLS
jgi:post-segregation antitoxin (ccd killing protein)